MNKVIIEGWDKDIEEVLLELDLDGDTISTAKEDPVLKTILHIGISSKPKLSVWLDDLELAIRQLKLK